MFSSLLLQSQRFDHYAIRLSSDIYLSGQPSENFEVTLYLIYVGRSFSLHCSYLGITRFFLVFYSAQLLLAYFHRVWFVLLSPVTKFSRTIHKIPEPT